MWFTQFVILSRSQVWSRLAIPKYLLLFFFSYIFFTKFGFSHFHSFFLLFFFCSYHSKLVCSLTNFCGDWRKYKLFISDKSEFPAEKINRKTETNKFCESNLCTNDSCTCWTSKYLQGESYRMLLYRAKVRYSKGKKKLIKKVSNSFVRLALHLVFLCTTMYKYMSVNENPLE